jgi:hypothetical protein
MAAVARPRSFSILSQPMQFRRHVACLFTLLLAAIAAGPAGASEPFPFGSELMREGGPPPGRKVVPMIEIDDNGTTTIDLWCGHVHAQASVGDDGSIAIVTVARDESQCDPQQVEGDDDLLDMVVHLTNWRRQGDLVEFSGPGAGPGAGSGTGSAVILRYYLMTN